jgi:diacylglycerol kinase family enzyme
VAAGAYALTRTLYELPHYTTRLSVDGGPDRALAFEQVFLNSMPYFAYNLRVDPAGDPGDGIGEAVILHAATRRHAARTLLASRRGRHIGHFGTEVVSWRTARLLDPVPLAADGEPLGVTSAEVAVIRGGLRLVAAREG